MLDLSERDWDALRLSLTLAGCTSVLLTLLATPLAWWLTRSRARVTVLVEAIVALPLVLPPTVLGFYLLTLLGPQGALGRALQALGVGPLPFSFGGILLGSLVYSLPFAVQPLCAAFAAVGPRMLEVSATLRAPPLATFFRVVAPLSRRGFISAAALSFAHTLGEFGVVLMLGGSIPRRTETASIAIFRQVEALDLAAAHRLAAILSLLCFVILGATYAMNRRARHEGSAT
ncbi:MAG TPA: molybdate ABC transporter permease subunit [Polyangiales bacterium]